MIPGELYTLRARPSAFVKPRKRAVAENTRRLAAGVPVFKSAVGSAWGGNKARLARASVARALEMPLLCRAPCCGITRNFLRDVGGNDVANYPRETRRNTRALRRGYTLGAITSVVMEVNVVIGKLKHDNAT